MEASAQYFKCFGRMRGLIVSPLFKNAKTDTNTQYGGQMWPVVTGYLLQARGQRLPLSRATSIGQGKLYAKMNLGTAIGLPEARRLQ